MGLQHRGENFFIDRFHVGFSSVFAHCFPILVGIWHTAVRLTGTLGTPRRGGAGFREEPQAGTSDKTISGLGAQGPDLGCVSQLCPSGFHKDLEGGNFPSLLQHESPFENRELIWRDGKIFRRSPHDSSCCLSIP